jgi:coenzyme F420-reducing hydrogenase gamma subunit
MAGREIVLPSGALLVVNAAPFRDARALYQAILHELRDITITTATALEVVIKDLFCAGFGSLAIEQALETCMARCLYNGLKIDGDTFEPLEARQDYMQACMEVAKDNVSPFAKPLFAEFAQYMKMAEDIQRLASVKATTAS